MKRKLLTKIATLISAGAITFSIPVSAYAYSVAGGDLEYYGGQNSTHVYSNISRRTGVRRNYKVRATVKVGGNTYTSGWKINKASKSAKRVWWANERAYYDYYSM